MSNCGVGSDLWSDERSGNVRHKLNADLKKKRPAVSYDYNAQKNTLRAGPVFVCLKPGREKNNVAL